MESKKVESEYQKLKSMEQRVTSALKLRQEMKNNALLFDEADFASVDECIEECQSEYNSYLQNSLSRTHKAMVYAINFSDVIIKREKVLQACEVPTEKLKNYFQQKTFLIALLAKEMAEIAELKNEGVVPL